MADSGTVDIVIRGVNKENWADFRKQCIDDDVSAVQKIRTFIDKTAKEYKNNETRHSNSR